MNRSDVRTWTILTGKNPGLFKSAGLKRKYSVFWCLNILLPYCVSLNINYSLSKKMFPLLTFLPSIRVMPITFSNYIHFVFEQTSHLKFLRLNSAKKQSFKFSWLAYSMLFIVSIFALFEIMKERMKKMSCVFNIWRCLVIFTLITLAAFFVIPFLN